MKNYIWPNFICESLTTRHAWEYEQYFLPNINTYEQAAFRLNFWNQGTFCYRYYWSKDAPSRALNKAR